MRTTTKRSFVIGSSDLRAECEGQGAHLPEDTFIASKSRQSTPAQIKKKIGFSYLLFCTWKLDENHHKTKFCNWFERLASGVRRAGGSPARRHVYCEQVKTISSPIYEAKVLYMRNSKDSYP